MLEFKMTNAAITATGGQSSTAYKAVPEHSTSAISSGLNRLFGTPALETHSRESPASSTSRQQQQWEASAAGQRHRARGLESVRQELDEYLEEPLETFSRIERVNGVEQTVIFDTLMYWQVCTAFFHFCQRL